MRSFLPRLSGSVGMGADVGSESLTLVGGVLSLFCVVLLGVTANCSSPQFALPMPSPYVVPLPMLVAIPSLFM